MDLQLLLIFVSLSSAVGTLWRSTMVFPVRYNVGWIIVSVVLLLVAGVGWLVIPDQFAYVLGGVWLALYAVPLVLSRVIARLSVSGRFEAARNVSYISRLFHPFDGWWSQPLNIYATQLERTGHFDAAVEIYSQLAQENPLFRDSFTVRMYQIKGDWQALIDDFGSRLDDPAIKINGYLLMLYVRALGEVGRVNDMVAALAQFQPRFQISPVSWHTALLFGLAFSGDRAGLEHLLDHHAPKQPEALREYWLAVAEQSSGNVREAEAIFTRLRDSKDAQVSMRAMERLSRGLSVPGEEVSAESRRILTEQMALITSNARYTVFSARGNRQRIAILTWLLILANALVFLMEIDRGGSTNIRTLYDMGALWASAVVDGGEWWRLVNAIFLHYGWLHLVLNMLALFIIGGFVETTLGRVRTLIVYCVAGVGASAMIVWMTQAGWIAPSVTVGASGAIMGLFGASAAILLIGWRMEQVSIARNHLTRITLLIFIQAIIDILVPQTSFTGHLSGAIIGFMVAFPMYFWMTRRQTRVTG